MTPQQFHDRLDEAKTGGVIVYAIGPINYMWDRETSVTMMEARGAYLDGQVCLTQKNTGALTGKGHRIFEYRATKRSKPWYPQADCWVGKEKLGGTEKKRRMQW